MSVHTSTIKHNAATSQIVVFVKVDETFTTIWLSGSSEVRVKVRRWPQSPFGTIFLHNTCSTYDILYLRIWSSWSAGLGLTQSAKAWQRSRRRRSHGCTRTSHLRPVKPCTHEYGTHRPAEPASRLSHSPCTQLHAAVHNRRTPRN